MRHSCAPLLPATTSTTHRRILMENTNLPFAIPGSQEWSRGTQMKVYLLMLFENLLNLFFGNRQMILVLLQP